jgi:hypothetical protein
MNRLYHPYWLWEDYKAGLYDLQKEYTEKEEEEMATKVKLLLSNTREFYSVAIRVVTEWKKSSEQNLTNSSRNKQAWIGQASCCYKFGIPERITKLGWRLLTPTQQKEANDVADTVIKQWEGSYVEKILKQKRIGSF